MPAPLDDNLGRLVLHGLPASEGVCQGPLWVLAPTGPLPIARRSITEADFPLEIRRLEEALLQTRHQLLDLQARVSAGLGAADARILDAQLLVLDDPFLHDEVLQTMRRDRVGIEAAFHDFTQRYITTLAAVEDKYLSERAADLRDVADRVLHNLLGRELLTDLSHLSAPCIVVAEDLSPSHTAALDRRHVLGLATDQGSLTSHTAILARALGLPAITGLERGLVHLRTGQEALLDGYSGLLIVEPTAATCARYARLERRKQALRTRLESLRTEPACTGDGHRLTLSANLESLDELPEVARHGAEGVGLFRTEYLFLNRPDAPPDEEEQYAAYREVVARLTPAPVIIRTLDLGGDKVPAQAVETERNPFLGWRAIRVCLEQPDLFRTQLRALLRAGSHGPLKIMYPMVTSLDELLEANALLDACRAELRAAGHPLSDTLEVGVMIETPAAVQLAEALARHAAFFSLGTNDLVQYTLAVDRLNPRVARLYEPAHPAVVRLIHHTIQAAHAQGRWVGVCGEMAGDPLYVPLLVGLGVDELSAAPARVPAVKFLLRRLDLPEARTLAAEALRADRTRDILEPSRALVHRLAPELFEAEPASPPADAPPPP